MSDGWEGKDLKTALLWDAYGALLTETQREITDLYFNYDSCWRNTKENWGLLLFWKGNGFFRKRWKSFAEAVPS